MCYCQCCILYGKIVLGLSVLNIWVNVNKIHNVYEYLYCYCWNTLWIIYLLMSCSIYRWDCKLCPKLFQMRNRCTQELGTALRKLLQKKELQVYIKVSLDSLKESCTDYHTSSFLLEETFSKWHIILNK